MFTDHERLPEAEFTQEVARQSGSTVLRGVELNVFVDAYRKPKEKLDKEIFYHLLVGFDPEGPQNPDYWLAHLKKECRNETRNIGGTDVHGFTSSAEDICKILEQANAIVIPAHLHRSNDIFRTRSVDDIYSDPVFLELARNHFTALEVTELRTADFFDGKHEETGNLYKTCIRSSDAHTPDRIGERVTWAQMERPTFAELKSALQMPFRVRLEPPTEPDSHIIGLNIRGQIFPDLWLSLSPHCNALIGVKGAGKTSVLECLRFALGAPVPDSRRDDVNQHLHAILGPAGSVRVLVKRRDGARVLVERANHQTNDFKLTFEDDRQSIVQNPDALMFPSYILGWHEIEQAATDPKIRQVYLDTIAGRERIRQLQEAADSAANKVKHLHSQAMARYAGYSALVDQVARLEDLRAGLQELTDSNLITLRDQYEIAVQQRDGISGLIKSIRDAREDIETRVEPLHIPAELAVLEDKSPLAPFAANAAVAVRDMRASVAAFADSYRQRLDEAASKLESQQSDLEAAFATFSQTYMAEVNSLPPEKQRLLESHRAVMEDTKSLPRLRNEVATEKASIETLLTQLVENSEAVAQALDDQTALRVAKVEELNSQLQDLGLHLEVAPMVRRTAFEELNARLSQGAQAFGQLNTFAPQQSRHHRRLASAYDSLRKDLLKGFTLLFRMSEFEFYLHAFEEDDLRISFAVGRPGQAYTPIDQLSAGQRCTAVFPLLLRLREGPLIVDQPEDNLDNRHIALSVAPALREDKRQRQIAFTSHNANLVVLTDAEHVALFEGHGSTGAIEARGFLSTNESAITPHVIAILDGGREALELRYKKYGLTLS